jgi:HlyD family secretion protein
MKLLIIIVLALSAAGGGWWYWKQSRPEEVKYQTGAVTKGDVTQVVSATGQLNPVLNVTVGSQISGNILKLYADYNSLVKANEVVAELDPAPYTAVVHQAEANVAFAKAALELAQLTADRKAELVKEHAAAQADLDTAMANLHQAQATLQIQQANLETAQINLDHCTITSPVDGIVISRSVDVGETVAASLNAPVLFTIANDLSKMQIDASIAEGDVGELEIGQVVNFNVDAYPTRTFHGVVAQVRNSPVTVQNVVTYDTVVSVNNADLKLKPGMTANLYVVIASHADVLKIPNAAFRFRPPEAADQQSSAGAPAGMQPTPKPHVPGQHGSAKTIYVLPAGATNPSPVQVKLGISDGIYTEVTDGLHDGDTVVTGILSGGPATGGQGGGGFGMRRPF